MRVPRAAPVQLISLVRHADAGARERFVGDDALRPLSRRGRRDAEALCRRLAEVPSEMVSSPYLRCVETLAPLSSRLRRAMTVTPVLGEGADPTAVLAYLLGEVEGGGGLVACSHGDVMTGIVELLSGRAIPIGGPVNLDKASTTELSVRAGAVCSVAFVAPSSR